MSLEKTVEKNFFSIGKREMNREGNIRIYIVGGYVCEIYFSLF